MRFCRLLVNPSIHAGGRWVAANVPIPDDDERERARASIAFPRSISTHVIGACLRECASIRICIRLPKISSLKAKQMALHC